MDSRFIDNYKLLPIMENTNSDDDLLFSKDPEENLHMENEFLRLKIQAELGGQDFQLNDIPPSIVNQFLKSVLEFERDAYKAKWIKIYDILGRPSVKLASELNDKAIEQALEEVIALLNARNIVIDYMESYDFRTKYKFITEEFFNHEIEDISPPGIVSHFLYEDFHPNHAKDIENRTVEFINGWFNQSLDEHSWELASHFILSNGKPLPLKEAAKQFKTVFARYASFTDTRYSITDIQWELTDQVQLGHSEGVVNYRGVRKSGEPEEFGGPFKLYFSMELGWWNIFYFVFPGFEFES